MKDEQESGKIVGSPQTIEVVEGVKFTLRSRHKRNVESAVAEVKRHFNIVWVSNLIPDVEGSYHQYLLTDSQVLKEAV